MFPMKKTVTFKISILRAFLFLLTLTVLSISTNFYFSSKRTSLELVEKIVKETTDKITERIAYYLHSPALQGQVLSSLLRKKPTENVIKIREKLWEQMWEQLLIYEQLESFSIADKFGNYVQVRRDDKGLATRYIDRTKKIPEEKRLNRDNNYQILDIKNLEGSYDPRVRKWYKNTGSEPHIYWTDTYIFKTTQKLGISISYPVVYHNNEVEAVVNLNIPLDNLSHFLANLKVTNNSLVFIVNKDHKLIAYPEIARLLKKDQQGNLIRDEDGEFQVATVQDLDIPHITEIYNAYLEKKQGDIFTVINNEKKYLVKTVDLPKNILPDWTIITIIPEKNLMEGVYASLEITIIIALVIFCIGIVFVIIFANRITKPLVALANQTKKIKDFELDDFKQIKSVIYEIKLMSDAAFSMVQGLQSFRRYVPAALVRELINAGKEAKLGASDELELTILFTDIQGFTSISESMKAQDLMLHLSNYFEHLSSIIMEEHGTIDKYIGDAIMAFWGAPQKLPNAAYLTCRAALRCQKTLKILNNQWIIDKKPTMFTRMGIHTGTTVVGNLGSQYRMNYTIIGDSANLASRLEGINKLYGTQIIISETTYQQISEQFICRPLDIVAVKGKKIGIKIYELIAEKSEQISEETVQFCREFERGFEAYLKQDWNGALLIFEALEKEHPEDLSVKLFIERCYAFQQHPVPIDWNGSIVLHEK